MRRWPRRRACGGRPPPPCKHVSRHAHPLASADWGGSGRGAGPIRGRPRQVCIGGSHGTIEGSARHSPANWAGARTPGLPALAPACTHPPPVDARPAGAAMDRRPMESRPSGTMPAAVTGVRIAPPVSILLRPGRRLLHRGGQCRSRPSRPAPKSLAPAATDADIERASAQAQAEKKPAALQPSRRWGRRATPGAIPAHTGRATEGCRSPCRCVDGNSTLAVRRSAARTSLVVLGVVEDRGRAPEPTRLPAAVGASGDSRPQLPRPAPVRAGRALTPRRHAARPTSGACRSASSTASSTDEGNLSPKAASAGAAGDQAAAYPRSVEAATGSAACPAVRPRATTVRLAASTPSLRDRRVLADPATARAQIPHCPADRHRRRLGETCATFIAAYDSLRGSRPPGRTARQ